MIEEIKNNGGLSPEDAIRLGSFVSGRIGDAENYSYALMENISSVLSVAKDDNGDDFEDKKPEVKSKSKNPSVFVNADGNYSDGTITSNKSQTEFINKFIDFASKGVAGSAFSLMGLGGTGKTTSVKLAIKAAGFDPMAVIYATHQNNAAKILAKATGSHAYTNFQAMQKKMQWNAKAGVLEAVRATYWNKHLQKPMPKKTIMESTNESLMLGNSAKRGIFIVDEASMLDSNMIIDMIKDAKENNFFVLFMGDSHQLPPVIKDSTGKSANVSPLYSNMKDVYGENEYELYEKVRTNQESDIAKVSDIIVNQIDEDPDQVPNIGGVDKGDGSVSYVPDIDNGRQMFIDKYSEDPENTRMLVINNQQNKAIAPLIYGLRSSIFGEKNISHTVDSGKKYSRYAVGEIVVLDSKDELYEGQGISVGTEVVVLTEPEEVTDYMMYQWWENRKIKKEALKTTALHQRVFPAEYMNIGRVGERPSFSVRKAIDFLKSLDKPNQFPKTVFAQPDSYNLFRELENAINSKSDTTEIEKKLLELDGKITEDSEISNLGASAYGLTTEEIVAENDEMDIAFPEKSSDAIKKSIRKYGETAVFNKGSTSLVINAHKAQGATYKNVFVDIANFDRAVKFSNSGNSFDRTTINKGLYVAVSRASEKLTFIGNAPTLGINNSSNSVPLRPFSYGFTVTPKAKPDAVKAVAKAKKSSQYIGFGKNGSSTELYAQQAYQQGVPINSGRYSDQDIVFASINGTPSKEDFKSTLKYVVAALNAGSVVLLDSSKYLKKSTYNKGEQELSKMILNMKDANGNSIYMSQDSKSGNFAAYKKINVEQSPVSTNKNDPIETKDTAPKEPEIGPKVRQLSDFVVHIGENKNYREFADTIAPDQFGRMNKKTKTLLRTLADGYSDGQSIDNSPHQMAILSSAILYSHPKDSSLKAMDITPSVDKSMLVNKDSADDVSKLVNEAVDISKAAKAKIVKDDISLGSDATMQFKEPTDKLELKSPDDIDKFLTSVLDENKEQNKIPTYNPETDSFELTDNYHNHLLGIKDILVDGMKRLYNNIDIKVNIVKTNAKDATTKGSFSYNSMQAFDENKSTIHLLESGSSEISTISEITMHESIHALVKGYLSKDRKMRNRIKKSQDLMKIVHQLGYLDYNTFLSTVNGEPTPFEIETAKKKFEYVFSDTTNPEEFLVYMLTNKSLYSLAGALDEDSINETGNAIITNKLKVDIANKDLSLVKRAIAYLKSLIRSSTGGMKSYLDAGSLDNEMLDVLSTIVARKEQMKSTFTQGFIERMIHLSNSYIPTAILRTPTVFSLSVFSKLVDMFNKSIGYVLGSKAIARIKKSASKIYDNIMGSSSMKSFYSNRHLGKIKNIIHSELVTSLWHRFFRAESMSGNKELYNYAKKKNKLDLWIADLKVNLEGAIKSLGKNSERISKAVMVAGSAGLTDYSLSTKYEDITKDIIEADSDFYKNDLQAYLKADGLPKFSDEVIEQLNALADYNANRKVSKNLHYLSVHNIMSVLAPRNRKPLNQSKQVVDMAKKYVEAQTLLRLNNTDFEHVRSLSGSNAGKSVLKILASKERIYRNNLADTRKRFITVPDVIDTESTFSNGRTVRYGTKKQAQAIGSTMIDKGPILKLSDGTEIYRYSTLNYAPSRRDGVYEKAASSIDGVDLKDVVVRAMLKDKNKIKDKDLNILAKRELAYLRKQYPNIVMQDSISGDHSKFYLLHDKAINDAIGDKDHSHSNQLVNKISSLARTEVARNYNKKLITRVAKTALKKSEIPHGQEDLYVSLATVMPDNGRAKKMYVKRHIALLLSGANRSTIADLKVFGHPLFANNQSAKNIIGTIEAFASDVASTAKSMAVLFTPAVVTGNIVSNMFSAYTMGVGPVRFVTQYIERWKNFNEIGELVKRRNAVLINPELTYEQATSEIARIDALLNANQDFKLYTNGHLSLSAEDVNTKTATSNSSIVGTLIGEQKHLPSILTKDEYDLELKREIEKIRYDHQGATEYQLRMYARRNLNKSKTKSMKKFSFIKTFAKNVTGADGTTVKILAEKNLLYSDAIAKSVILEHRIESGVAKNMEDELSILNDVFVNYDFAQGGVEQWFEDIAQFHFLKYYSSSMKAAFVKAKTNKRENTAFYGTEILTDVNIVSPDDSFMKNSMVESMANRNQLDDFVGNITLPIQSKIDDMASLDGVQSSIFSSKMSFI